MAGIRDGVSRGVNDESVKIFSDLRSREDDVRSRAALELKEHVSYSALGRVKRARRSYCGHYGVNSGRCSV
jgi:hypothetical protein